MSRSVVLGLGGGVAPCSPRWRRRSPYLRGGRAAVNLGVAVALCLGLPGCSSESLAVEPDLTPLITKLTSPDALVQETGLVSALRRDGAPPQPLLPTGSTLSVSPGTWKAVKRDAQDRPYLAEVQANLNRPNQPQTLVDLKLAYVDDQWLLYETSSL